MTSVINIDDDITSKDLKDDKKLFQSFYIALTSLVIEGVIIFLIAYKSISGLWFFLPHLIICSLVFLYCYKSYKHKEDIRFSAIFFVMFLVTGCFGSLVFIIIVFHYLLYAKTSSTFAQWFASLFPEEKSSKSEKLYERILYGLDDIAAEAANEPFRNILTYGTLQQKQLVISKITKHFSPNLAEALLKAVDDPEASIRVQAATAIAKIENNFVKKYIEIEKALKKNPGDIDLMLKFAKFCDDYANSKILDKERENESRNKAIQMYEKCIKVQKKGHNIRRSLGKLYEQNGEFDKAYEWLKKCVDEEGMKSPELIMSYMETLFHRGDYKEIRKLTREYENHFQEGMPFYRRTSALVDLWKSGIAKETLILNIKDAQ